MAAEHSTRKTPTNTDKPIGPTKAIGPTGPSTLSERLERKLAYHRAERDYHQAMIDELGGE
jgi:hypothetical protein